MLLPLILIQTVTSFSSGFLTSKTGNYQLQLWFGFAIWAVACGLLSTISAATSEARLIGYQILSGVGAGQTFQTSLVAIQASVVRKDMAVATGTRNFVRLLGGTVALAGCAAILNNTVRQVSPFLKLLLSLLLYPSGHLTDQYSRNELMDLLPSDAIASIVSDPTQISAGTLGLSNTQTSAAILAYSK